MNNQDYTQERRINPDLLDLLIIILKHKWLIIGFLIFTYLVTFSFFYLSSKKTSVPAAPSKEIYYSECIIDGGDLADKVKAKLISRSTIISIGQFFNLPALRQTGWDEKNSKWVTEQIYYWDQQTKAWTSIQPPIIQDMETIATLSIKSQNRLITLRFNNVNPEIPPKALYFCLDYVSEFFRKPILEYYKSQMDIYRKQLAHAQDPVLKGRLFEQYSNLIDRDTRAKNSKFYGMEMVDPPFMSEKDIKSGVTSSPPPRKTKYGTIIALMTLLSLVISVSFIFFIEYIAKMRKSDPERFNLISKYLRFR